MRFSTCKIHDVENPIRKIRSFRSVENHVSYVTYVTDPTLITGATPVPLTGRIKTNLVKLSVTDLLDDYILILLVNTVNNFLHAVSRNVLYWERNKTHAVLTSV